MALNPILLDLPFPITTKRLLIRPPAPGDGLALNEAVLESFQELQRWMPWAAVKPTVEDSEEIVRRAFSQWVLREDLMMLIFNKETKIFVGGTGLHRLDWSIPRFEIGYWVRKSCVGQGMITESTAALTSYAFKELKARRVEIRCDATNVRSSRIPERLGYKLEASLKNYELKPHTRDLRDSLIYARLDNAGLVDEGVSW